MDISITQVVHASGGIEKAKDFLYSYTDASTLLLLSGGNTPQALYKQLAEESLLTVGAVAMVDERYGLPFHEKSNEKMIEESGLIRYLSSTQVPFYSILEDKPLDETAADYEKMLVFLFAQFRKSIAIMGVGDDGHTAGLPAGIQSLKFKVQNEQLVTSYNDEVGRYGERITMTFKALGQVGQNVILAFGDEKRNALQKMLEAGSMDEIPARFYARPEIAKKTLLITDQKL